MKRFIILLGLLSLSISLQAQLMPKDTDGDGYYNISTLDHLRWVSENDSSWTWNFELDNDIDAGETKNWNNGVGWSPIGSKKSPFTGKFNGNGFKIDSLFINLILETPIEAGFFGYIADSSCLIKELGISNHNINISSKFRNISGGLVGMNYKANIIYCYSTGSINGISKTSNTFCGGLVGWNKEGIIKNCYSMSSSHAVTLLWSYSPVSGGLVGWNDEGIIKNCYSIGKVTSETSGSSLIGGLIGKSSKGSINNCFWDIETSAKTSSRGGTPKTSAQMKTKNTFIEAGWYFINAWNIDSKINDGYPYIKINKYLAIQPRDTDGNGYRNISKLDHLRWVSENDSSWTWNFELDNDINAGETRKWNDGAGFLSIGDSINKFTGIFDGQAYKIDSLYINKTMSREFYVGLFAYISGEGCMIKNLSITNSNMNAYSYESQTCIVGGLVGKNLNGKIINCNSSGFIKAYSSGIGESHSYAGGLVGINYGTVVNSYFSGSVNAITGSRDGSYAFAGGLIATNYDSVCYCYSSGSVYVETQAEAGCSSSGWFGGLIGLNSYGIISNCYSLSSVNGTSFNEVFLGGLVGMNDNSEIKNCYSTGTVTSSERPNLINIGGLIGKKSNDTVINSFWDKESSSVDSSAGGIGKTTIQMKTKNTFTNSDWNFTEIWAIDSQINEGYPYLNILFTDIKEDTDKDRNNIVLFPNPIYRGGVLNIFIEKPILDYKINVYNVEGELVANYQNQTYIPLSNTMHVGVYFIIIELDNNNFYKEKIIVK